MDQLDSLLNDLQRSTTAFKQAHPAEPSRQQQKAYSPTTADKEPLYEEQHIETSRLFNKPGAGPLSSPSASKMPAEKSLQDLEQMLDNYSAHRDKRRNDRPTVESLLGELDPVLSVDERNKYPSASATSRDLDDLMSSLSEFKVTTVSRQKYTKTTNGTGGTLDNSTPAKQMASQVAVEPSYAQPVKAPQQQQQQEKNGFDAHPAPAASTDTAQLDHILGSLSSDLSKHGIATIPKGECAGCSRIIVGQVVIALGRMWHPEHFTCSQCKEELGHRNFFERAGCAYCEADYHSLFSPRCAYCNGPIKDKCVTALDKTWHPEHFFCATCGKEFGEDGFHEKDGRAYCRTDFFAAFAPKCRGCKRAIQNNYVTALNNHWHPECFVCQGYDVTFEDFKVAPVVV